MHKLKIMLASSFVLALLGSAALACPDKETEKSVNIDRPVTPGAKVAMATFSVKGMHCEGCADHVKEALAKTDGIFKVDVKVADHRVTISYDSKKISTSKIAKILTDAGYEAATEA